MNIKNYHYVTLNEMMTLIRTNIYKIPHDIDFVIGVPRSGMIAGTVIAEFLNVPLIDLNNFCIGGKPTGGVRTRYGAKQHGLKPKALVIDDTTFSGHAMKTAKAQLQKASEVIDFVYAVVYKEGPSYEDIDLYLEDNSQYIANEVQVIYEWNIFHHHPHVSLSCMYDLDGVLCLDPPYDREDYDKYIEYIKDATPLFCPTTIIGAICTYRIEKNKEITKKWLEDHNIKCNKLYMFNAQSIEERDNSGVGPAEYKAHIYGKEDKALLFIESEDWQAQTIYQLTGKAVLSIETNTLYGGA